MSGAAENVLHHTDQAERPGVPYAVVDPVGVLARGENALVAQDAKMLRDVALGGPDLIHNFLYADFAITENAEDLQAQRMGHGLERAGSPLDIFVLGHQTVFDGHFVFNHFVAHDMPLVLARRGPTRVGQNIST